MLLSLVGLVYGLYLCRLDNIVCFKVKRKYEGMEMHYFLCCAYCSKLFFQCLSKGGGDNSVSMTLLKSFFSFTNVL